MDGETVHFTEDARRQPVAHGPHDGVRGHTQSARWSEHAAESVGGAMQEGGASGTTRQQLNESIVCVRCSEQQYRQPHALRQHSCFIGGSRVCASALSAEKHDERMRSNGLRFGRVSNASSTCRCSCIRPKSLCCGWTNARDRRALIHPLLPSSDGRTPARQSSTISY